MLLMAAVAIMAVSCTGERKAKYVFYFIGDGMGFSHISLAEGYKATVEGKVKNCCSWSCYLKLEREKSSRKKKPKEA